MATGPLTSAPLCAEIARLTGSGQLAFYDSISPIVEADSIDMERVYFAARYDKGTADYINCPMSKEEYERFYDALVSAEAVESKEWEKLEYFEGCLPIEELARRGRETLRFGPMKPVGLRDPRTGKVPWAVVQLRCENLRADSYNLVGLQNHLKFGEQARVLRLIPGLEKAKFLRFGQIHRNTYVNAPRVLTETLSLRDHPRYPHRRAAIGGGGLHRIHCHRHARRPVCRPACPGACGCRRTSRNRTGFAGALHYPCPGQGLPTREYHLRSAAAAGRVAAQADPRQAGAAPPAVRARLGAF